MLDLGSSPRMREGHLIRAWRPSVCEGLVTVLWRCYRQEVIVLGVWWNILDNLVFVLVLSRHCLWTSS